jgi:hypothetical protein
MTARRHCQSQWTGAGRGAADPLWLRCFVRPSGRMKSVRPLVALPPAAVCDRTQVRRVHLRSRVASLAWPFELRVGWAAAAAAAALRGGRSSPLRCRHPLHSDMITWGCPPTPRHSNSTTRVQTIGLTSDCCCCCRIAQPLSTRLLPLHSPDRPPPDRFTPSVSISVSIAPTLTLIYIHRHESV